MFTVLLMTACCSCYFVRTYSRSILSIHRLSARFRMMTCWVLVEMELWCYQNGYNGCWSRCKMALSVDLSWKYCRLYGSSTRSCNERSNHLVANFVSLYVEDQALAVVHFSLRLSWCLKTQGPSATQQDKLLPNHLLDFQVLASFRQYISNSITNSNK